MDARPFFEPASDCCQLLQVKVAFALAGSAAWYHHLASTPHEVVEAVFGQFLSEQPKPKVEELGDLSDLWSRTQKLVLLTVWRMKHDDVSWIGRFAARCRLRCSCCCRQRRCQASSTRSKLHRRSPADPLIEASHPDSAAEPDFDEESGISKEAKVDCSLPSACVGIAASSSSAPRIDSPEEDEPQVDDEVVPVLPAACSVFPETSDSEDRDLDAMVGSWTSAFDAGTTVSDLEVYVHHFCPRDQNFSAAAAEKLADFGTELWRTSSSSSSFSAYPYPAGMQVIESLRHAVNSDPARAASALVWALMRQALCQSKGFEQGTFVVHGPGVEEVFFILLPHTYDRNSSHFPKSVMWLTSQDIERFPFAEVAAKIEARVVKGSSHVGMDLPVDGVRDLPAGKSHVVLGRIRQHDGSTSLYLKPEEHGFDLSARKMGEAAFHAASYITSQVQRHFGDRRAHDEGELKRKEYVPVQDKARFDELLMELRSSSSNAKTDDTLETTGGDRVRCYGLGEMARTLRVAAAAAPAGPHRDGAMELLRKWEKIHGPWLDFQRGREVLIHTSCFQGC